MRLRHVIPTGAVLLAALSLPSAVHADCDPVASIEEALSMAEIAFVGTVVASARGVGTATFRVEEVWIGSLGETVEVFGLNANGPAEDDRTWQLGARYLVIPYAINGRLVDHICSGTAPWNEALAALRPPAAPGAEEPSGAPAPLPVIILGATAVLVGVAGWLAFRQRDRSG